MIYTVLAYRPNGADYCKGCLMGTSDSDFEFHTGDNLDQAARFAAEIEFGAPEGYEFCGYEFTYLVNGKEYLEQVDCPEIDFDPEWYNCLAAEKIIGDRVKEILTELKAEAEKARKAQEKQAKAAAKRRRVKAAKDAHKAELELLAKLKAKHEGDCG